MMMRLETKSVIDVFMVKDNKSISNCNVRMKLFGSTNELDGLDDGMWDGRLIESFYILKK